MTDLQYGNPNYLYLLTILVVGVALLGYATWARRRAAKRFAPNGTRQSNRAGRRLASAALVLCSLALLSLALVDIRWGKRWQETAQKGIEVMFVLDVSRSMLAEDISPNRLARAKQQIEDMMDEMAGDRIGLVVFAGETRLAVPLTSHYDDFKQVLETVGPHSVQLGGSRLAAALSAAEESFLGKTNDHKAVVIFTDGEDQESDPVQLAKNLHEEKGVRVFTVGLGDMTQGARIPDESSGGGFVRHEGEQVWSRMNGEILKEIAAASQGAYVPAGTKQVDMANVYHQYVASIGETEFETARIKAYIPRFQWFALPAFLLLCLEILVSTSRSRQAAAPAPRPVQESPALELRNDSSVAPMPPRTRPRRPMDSAIETSFAEGNQQ